MSTDKAHPAPDRPGHYWARLVRPSRMPEREDWASVDWEVVQVIENGGDPAGPEFFGVFVPGVPVMQWLPDFIWGPRVQAYRP